MLVLSREKFEQIIINDDIKIQIVDIRGGKVRIGIEAPDDVVVWRKEVYDQIQARKLNQKTQSAPKD